MISADTRRFSAIIIPLIFEQLLNVSVGMIDTIMVSTCGEAAISSVALVDNINRLIIQLLTAFGTGGVVIMSHFFGAGNNLKARRTESQLGIVMLIFTAFITFLFCFFTRPILMIFFGGVEDSVMTGSVIYLFLTGLSCPFLAIYSSSAAAFRAVGNTKIGMKVSFIGNIVNILFNAIFVFGLKLGVLGVGTATLISRIFCGITMQILSMSNTNPLKISFSDYKFFDKKIILKILKIGIPGGIENSMFQIGKIALVSLVATLGTTSIAANSIGYQIIDFPNIPGMAIGVALVTVAGQSIGAGNLDKAYSDSKKLIKYSYIGDWICKISLFILAPFVVSIFKMSPEATKICVTVLRMFSIASLPGWSLSFTVPCALRGGGDVNYAMLISILSMWICRIGVSWILVKCFSLGVYGIWIGMFADWYVRGIFFTARFLSKKWLSMNLV